MATLHQLSKIRLLTDSEVDLREINEAMEVQQLTNDELDLVAGGEDPDSGGQFRRRVG